MGQRTQIFLVVEDKDQNRRVNVYHDQWGIGRRMPLALMHLFIKFYNKDYNADVKDVFTISDGELRTSHEYSLNYNAAGHLVDANGYVWNMAAHKRELDKMESKEVASLPQEFEDWFTPKTYDDFTSHFCDNNNGVMVLFVREYKGNSDDWQMQYDMKVGFLLGYEDAGKGTWKAFSKWLTPKQYLSLRINKNYADTKFQKLFKDFMGYFGIEPYIPEAEKKPEKNVAEATVTA